MTRYRPLLELELRHAYWGDTVPPVRAVLRDAATHDRNGILSRSRASTTLVGAQDDAVLADNGVELVFDIVAQSTEIFGVTVMPPDGVPADFEIALGVGEVSALDLAGNADPCAPEAIVRPDAARGGLARLRLTLTDTDAVQPARLTATLAATESFWTYHVLGQPRDADGVLDIRDTRDDIRFSALPPRPMPDGRLAASFRTDRPLPTQLRSAQRFELVQAGPFGPRTLVAALPAPGGLPSVFDQPGAGRRLQSEIFVNPW